MNKQKESIDCMYTEKISPFNQLQAYLPIEGLDLDLGSKLN